MPPPAEGFASRLFLGPALRTQPDRRLVTLVREGYEAAFEEIVRRYGRPLGHYAASIVGGRSEDVLQDAFARALPALRRDDAEIDLRPWLFRIVRNTALNDLRDSPPSPELLAEALAGGRNPAEELECREELADLMKRLQELPEPQRAAIVMRELEGLGHEEIAAALGLTGGGARQAIYRARQALRDGAGMLIPLPLLQALLGGGGPGMAETAAGAGMSAAGAGGAAGTGIALKATAATVLVAGAVGAGVAIKDNPPSGNAKAAQVRISPSSENQTAAEQAAAERDTNFSQGVEESNSSAGRHGHGSGEAEVGDDHGGRGKAEPGDDRGGESKLVDDHHGPRGHGKTVLGEDRGGHDGSSAQHGGSSGSGGDDRNSSSGHGGSGSSGSGPSGSSDSGHGGSSGSGSGHDGSDSGELSGSGSGSSGSGHDDLSGSSGGSGGGESGPSGEPAPEEGSSGSDSGSGGSGMEDSAFPEAPS